MINRIKVLIAVVILGGLAFGLDKAIAIDASKYNSMMTISPPREKIILVPGETYEGTISVTNSHGAEKDLKYSAYVGSFSMRKDENGNTDYNNTDVDTVTGYNQMMDWIVLDKEGDSVAPGETDSLSYKINVPKDAPGGGQYASIIIRNDTNKDDPIEGGVAIQNVVEFAVGIIAEVAGETEKKGEVLDNNIPAFVLNGPLTATSMVRNDGNVHSDATYTLEIWPMFSDEEICTNAEEPETSLIMPGTERYHAQSSDQMDCHLPAVGIFRAKQTVKIFDKTSTVERIVIMCPLWLMFIILFVIVLLVSWIFMKVRGRRKKKVNVIDGSQN